MRRTAEPALLTMALAASVGLVLGALGRGALPAGGVARVGTRDMARDMARDMDKPVAAGAETAGQIPARGWWRIVTRVFWQIGAHRLMTEAAGVTFYVLLALFPALAALVSLYGLFADPATISQHLANLAGVLPQGAMDIVTDQVTRVAANGGSSLGFGLALGLATSLWSANAGIKSVFDSLNVVYDERETRGYVHLTLLSLGLTLGALVFMCLALAGVVALPVALNFVGLGHSADVTLRFVRWPLLAGVLVLGLAVLYRFGPSREQARWRWITWGSALAIIAWAIVSIGFSWYVANFGSYNRTYGSLGAVAGFMTWIWLSALMVLIGAEVDAELERQTDSGSMGGRR